MAKIARIKDSSVITPVPKTRQAKTISWQRFPIMNNPALRSVDRNLKKAKPWLKKTSNVLKTCKKTLNAVQTIINLLKKFEALIKNTLYTFLNSIVALLRQYLNDAKSTGVYFLNLTAYHWTKKAVNDNLANSTLRDMLSGGAWFEDGNKSDEQNKAIVASYDTDTFGKVEKVAKAFQEFGYFYKRETYNEFIETICNSFMDQNDVCDGFWTFNGLDQRKANFSSLLGYAPNPEMHNAGQCGRPDFGPNGRIMGYVGVLVVSDYYQLYKATYGVWKLLKDSFDILPKELQAAYSKKWFDKGQWPKGAWPSVSAQVKQGEEPNFQGVTVGYLLKPIFDEIENFLAFIESLSYNVDTSLLDSISETIQSLMDEIDRMIKMLEYIDDMIDIIDAFIQLTNMYVLYFDTEKASIGGNAGVCELLRSADARVLFPLDDGAKIESEMLALAEEANLDEADNQTALTDNNTKMIVAQSYVTDFKTLSVQISKCKEYLINNGINPTVVFTTDQSGKANAQFQQLGEAQKNVIWYSQIASKCSVHGLFIYPKTKIGSKISDGIYRDGDCSGTGAHQIEYSPLLQIKIIDEQANVILDRDDSLGRVYNDVTVDPADTIDYVKRTGVIKTAYELDNEDEISGIVIGGEKQMFLKNVDETLAELKTKRDDMYKQHYDFIHSPQHKNANGDPLTDVEDYETNYANICAQIKSLEDARLIKLEELNFKVYTYHGHIDDNGTVIEAGAINTFKDIIDYLTLDNITARKTRLADVTKVYSDLLVSTNQSWDTITDAYTTAKSVSQQFISDTQTTIDNNNISIASANTAIMNLLTDNEADKQAGGACKYIFDFASITLSSSMTITIDGDQYTLTGCGGLTTADAAKWFVKQKIKNADDKQLFVSYIDPTNANKVVFMGMYAGTRIFSSSIAFAVVSNGAGTKKYEKLIADQEKSISAMISANTSLNDQINARYQTLTSLETNYKADLKNVTRLQWKYNVYLKIAKNLADYMPLIETKLQTEKTRTTLLATARQTYDAIKEQALKMVAVKSMSENEKLILKKAKVNLDNILLTPSNEEDISFVEQIANNLVIQYQIQIDNILSEKAVLLDKQKQIEAKFAQVSKLHKKLNARLKKNNNYLDPNAKNFYIGGLVCWGYPTETIDSVKGNFTEITKKTYNEYNSEMIGWKQEYSQSASPIKKLVGK